jgi:hypothetical protein
MTLVDELDKTRPTAPGKNLDNFSDSKNIFLPPKIPESGNQCVFKRRTIIFPSNIYSKMTNYQWHDVPLY